MTIGKIYYLSIICGKLYEFLFFMKFPLTIAAGVTVACYVTTMMDNFKHKDLFINEITLAKKCLKWTVIPLLLVVIVSMFVPSKEDFLIIAMTKDYTTQQVYTMTKDEIKDGIDYFVNQLNKVKRGY